MTHISDLISSDDVIITTSETVANLILKQEIKPKHLTFSTDPLNVNMIPTKILLSTERRDIIAKLKEKYPTAEIYYPPNTKEEAQAVYELERSSIRTKQSKIHHYLWNFLLHSMQMTLILYTPQYKNSIKILILLYTDLIIL